MALWTIQWRHNKRDGVSNHQPHDCLLNCLFRRRSKETSKLYTTGLCAWNSPVTGEFPEQRASNTENVSIWWPHHELASAREPSGVFPLKFREVHGKKPRPLADASSISSGLHGLCPTPTRCHSEWMDSKNYCFFNVKWTTRKKIDNVDYCFVRKTNKTFREQHPHPTDISETQCLVELKD